MEYIFMAIAVIAIASQNTLVGLYNKKVKNSSPFVLAFCFSFIAFLGFMLYWLWSSKLDLHLSWFTAVCGLSTGAVCFLHFVCLQQALKRGPVSLTNLFVSYSLLIPTIFSLIMYDKQLYASAVIGIVLLCISIAMTNKWKNKKNNLDEQAESKKFNFWYVILVLLAVATNGSFSILQQVHTRHFAKADNPLCQFMIMTMSFVIVANLIGMIATKKNRAQVGPSFIDGWKFVFPNGVIYFVILLMQMWLNAGQFMNHDPNMSIVNPVLAAGSLVLTLLSSVFIFKEKLSVVQWIGVALGVFAIVFLNIKFVKIADWQSTKNTVQYINFKLNNLVIRK